MSENTSITSYSHFTPIKATGPLCYQFTNDYMFRAIMQKSNKTLKHLLAAMLHIPYESIISCEIQNPIILGDHVDDKTCIMDIKVLLNRNRLINIELQMGHFENWAERALFNLARLYSNIEKGEDYSDILPSVHIGILAKAPFIEKKEFYSEYKMVNRKNMHVLSGNFSLYVLDLSQTDTVSDTGELSELYHWAKLFKAQTWEEVQKLMEKSDAITEAAYLMYELSKNKEVRMKCEAIERYYMDKASFEKNAIKRGMQEGRELGIKEGRQEGIKEGIKEGRQEGIKEGIKEGRQEGIKEGCKALIKTYQEFGKSYEETQKKITEEFALDEASADEYMKEFWTEL